MSRMRVLSSRQVIESAEQLIKKIIDAGAARAIALTDLQARYESLDAIRDFSESCRAEFDHLRAKQF
jgi:enoyl-CoA hydratase/carnithine racemase